MASTRTYGGQGTPVDEQSLGELFATFSRDMSLLVHQEIELAKSEVAESAKKAGVGGGLLGGAGVFAMWGLFLMTFAAGFGIAAGANLSLWVGFLIDGGVFLVVAGVLAAIGGLSLKKIGGPERTKATIQASLATLKGKRGAAALTTESSTTAA
jgi:ABC-type transport system involved in multi-copper enzyme maturation permease subunit